MSVTFNLNDLHKKFITALKINSRHVQDISDKTITSIIQNNPKHFLRLLEENVISFNNMSEELKTQVFFFACNMVKEIDSQLKLLGLRILKLMTHHIKEDYLVNAYVFEKKSYRAFAQNPKKKFVSIGDYELLKFDETSGVNFGYFASALEEENKEIKIETLRLIGILGNQENFKQFADQSVKYIVELINDEEDEVRFTTIEVLKLLITNTKFLDVGSREIIFFNLKEKLPKLRGLLYELISYINYNKLNEFQKGVKRLNENLRLFPEDKINIYKCIKYSSQVNCRLINVNYINKILGFDCNFFTPESSWEDKSYIANLVILQEFIINNTNSKGLFVPKNLIKHYSYLCEKYPTVFRIESYHLLLTKYDKRLNSIHQPLDDILFKSEQNDLTTIEEITRILDSSKNFDIIYNNIVAFINILQNERNHFLILPLVNKIINILERINLQIHMSNCLDTDLIKFNNELCSFVLKEFNSKYGLIDKFKAQENLNYDYSYEQIKSKFPNASHANLNEIKVTSPKNGFNYIHSKVDRNFPFFLQITIKLTKFRLEQSNNFDFKIFLIKNLYLHLEYMENITRINLDYSSITEHDDHIIIKDKLPIFIQEPNLEYKFSLHTKSKHKKNFIRTLEQIGINQVDNCDFVRLFDDILFSITY